MIGGIKLAVRPASTVYTLFPAAAGPATPASSGNFIPGIVFTVTSAASLIAYRYWVTPTSPTAAQKFCLWQVTGTGTGTLIPGATVTSGTLTAGAWNIVTCTHTALTVGTPYVACTGFTGGWPETDNQFGTGGPYAAGITDGPLMAYSDLTGSNQVPGGWLNQGVFNSSGSTDPAVTMPASNYASANFWMDVQVA